MMKKTILLLVFSGFLVGCNKKTSVVQEDLQLTGESLTQVIVSPSSSNFEEKIKEASMAAEINQAIIKTKYGEIKLKLFDDQAPNTVKNFVKKAEEGFYNNLNFHRVEDWVVQGGDPKGNGTGGGSMPTELNDVKFERGSLGVARGGDIKVSNDAQFFICTKDCDWLTGQYTNFGKVTSGMEVVDKIKIGDKILEIALEE